jgi:hypothetical protein
VSGGGTESIPCFGTGSEIKIQHQATSGIKILTLCGFAAYAVEAVKADASYTLEKSSGQCCRGDDIYISSNGFSSDPQDCEPLCDSNSLCKFFDHSTEWNNCVLCADCDEDGSGDWQYLLYTAWEKVTTTTELTTTTEAWITKVASFQSTSYMSLVACVPISTMPT